MTNFISISPFDYPYLSVSLESTLLAILLDHYARKTSTSSFDQIQIISAPNVDENQTQLSLTPSGLQNLPDTLDQLELVGLGGVIDLTKVNRLEEVPHLLKCYTSLGFLAESVNRGNEDDLNTIDDVSLSDTLLNSCLLGN